MLPRWERRSVRSLAKTRVVELRGVQYFHPTRLTEREFSVIHAPDWVNVIALTATGEMVLVRQFRFGVDDFSLEIPGGVIDSGEDPVAAGLRELVEETGFGGGVARLLGSVHPNPAIQDNRCHLVVVEGVTAQASMDWDPDEEIEVVVLPVDEVYQRAYRGEITHALVLNGLLLFAPHWATLRSKLGS